MVFGSVPTCQHVWSKFPSQPEVTQLQSLSCFCLALASAAFVYDWGWLARLTLVTPMLLMLWQALRLGLSPQKKKHENLCCTLWYFPLFAMVKSKRRPVGEDCLSLFWFNFSRTIWVPQHAANSFSENRLWLRLGRLLDGPLGITNCPVYIVQPFQPVHILLEGNNRLNYPATLYGWMFHAVQVRCPDCTEALAARLFQDRRWTGQERPKEHQGRSEDAYGCCFWHFFWKAIT